MITAGDELDVKAMVGNNVRLFRDDDDGKAAWEHFVKHALNNGDEWEGWCLLLDKLAEERAKASDMTALRLEVERTSMKGQRKEVIALYHAFLEVVAKAIEEGVRLKWHWKQQELQDASCWHTLATCGVRGVMTEERVRTGHLLCGAPFGKQNFDVERYNLFIRCLKKMRAKYQAALQNNLIADRAGPEFQTVLNRDPDLQAWKRLSS